MRLTHAVWVTVSLLLFSPSLIAQNKTVQLRTGKLSFEPNLRSSAIDSFNTQIFRYHTKTLFVLQFKSIPSAASRKALLENGIELLDYISGLTYTASVTGNLKLAALQIAGGSGFLPLQPRYKLEPTLAAGIFPAHAVKISGTIDVSISFAKTFSLDEVEQFLIQKNIDIISKDGSRFGQLILRIASARIEELASYPFIQYVQAVPPEPTSLNQNARQLSRANVLNASMANGGKGLNGEGVVVGIGDNSEIQRQVDFAGRLIVNRNFLSGSHGIHVTGTAAGAGNINELYRGYAPRAKIISDLQGAIIHNTPLYAQDYNMMITNNSYGFSPDCQVWGGIYDSRSRYADLIALAHPQVLHVFAVGNSGEINCSPYPPGFNSIASGEQSAKNILCVGATTDSAVIATLSSRGPVRDGRIKPEITALGQRVISNWGDNIYISNQGTSMAAPSVTGGAALLYQRYHQLHSNNNPKSGLIKAILCNGADDKGNPGPDYTYGFGMMNLLRSVDILEKQHYFIGSAANNATTTYTIIVPPGIAQLKVMLYWNDPASIPIGYQALINDLDAEVVTPTNNTVLPKILDTLPQNVNNVAVNGADHINNIEQVIIDNPPAGNYTIRVKGTTIPQGPQEYYLVYDIVPASLNITYPVGGEGLVPGEFIKLSWDAYGNAGNTFNLDYSIDNGNTWSNIAVNVQAERRLYTWQVPDIASPNALIRISQNGSGLTSISHPFTIIGLPVVTLAPSQCEGSVVIQWAAVQNATDYEVTILKGESMETAGITSSTSWHFNSLSPDTVYWVAVRARINGKGGRRSIAISRQPNNGNCSGVMFDNDLKLDTVLAPLTGRKYTSTELSAAQLVKVRIKNLDDAPANGFNIMYSVNGGPWVMETINTTIAAGAVYEHSFAATADFSALGNYTLKTVVKNLAPDPIILNDTLIVLVRQLDNQVVPVNLTTSFLDDLETAAIASYRADIRGLNGLDRYDFENITPTGELLTFMNSGVAYSGNRSFLLGEHITRTFLSKGLNTVTGTFNLAGKSANAHDVRLDFRYIINLVGINAGINNDVWIRGSDTQPWIKVLDFNGNLNPSGNSVYKLSRSIDVADSLVRYGQDFTSSFQVRWRESGYLPKYPGRLYSIDDIRLYEVQHDLQFISIDTPVVITCGLSSAMPVKISIYNSSNTPLTNVPVKYAINEGSWVTETIPFIAANTRLQYQFTQAADLSIQGSYRIKAAIAYPDDTYRANDSATLELKNLPLITSYPHLQNFELDNGGWYAEGTNSSWEYGTPSSPNINRAASGAKAWKTKLSGTHNENEFSYLYSPCYQLNGMTKPALSFSFAIDVEACNTFNCDYARIEYSVDGITWKILGTPGNGTNWYNNNTRWDSDHSTYWHVATIPLPVASGLLRLRFFFSGDTYLSKEGIAFDDIHIYDNDKGIYDGVTLTSPVTKTVSGNNWIDFESNGKLIASVHPNGQDLGSTDIQTYINTGAVRYTGSQYYHDRNISIKPSIKPNDSVAVRFYFLDKESDSLIKATGCALCTKPGTAYALGVSKYSNTNRTLENGDVADNNLLGNWSYIHSDRVKKVPFDKGYYAEFKVKDFSEFWLNNGGLDNNSALPDQVFEFTAQRVGANDVLLQWKTGNETGVIKYEIEVARGNEAFQNNQFEKIGEVLSQPTGTVHQYNVTDVETDKFGHRHYRLKILNTNGSINYSPVRVVIFEEAVQWTIYPNPSPGMFNLVGQFAAGQKLNATVIDAKGRLIRQYNIITTGFLQRISVDLSSAAAGIYFLRMDAGAERQVYKIYKQ